MSRELHILDGGPLCTVQDQGRFGWEHIGIPRGGAVDYPTFCRANALVGNDRHAAALESVLAGPVLKSGEDLWIAVSGAESVWVAGREQPVGVPFLVSAGAEMRVGRSAGSRLYIAVAGGVAVPPVLGSRSTNLEAGFGGFEGRPLRAGDRLPLGPVLAAPRPVSAVLADARSEVSHTICLRAVPWPSLAPFASDALSVLVSRTFTVDPRSNHVGVRLSGPRLETIDGVDRFSQPMPPGAIQVPPSGQPIVLLNGRGTIGGYPVLATVARVDLWRLGQARPGDQVRFSLVTVEQARALTEQALLQLENELAAMETVAQ